MEYKDQLKTSAWLRKKHEVMERDGYVCVKCLCDNFEKQLEVHHITYHPLRKAWEYPDYLLVTLCRDCHQQEHDKLNIYDAGEITTWIVRLLKPSDSSLNQKDDEPQF